MELLITNVSRDFTDHVIILKSQEKSTWPTETLEKQTWPKLQSFIYNLYEISFDLGVLKWSQFPHCDRSIVGFFHNRMICTITNDLDPAW